MSHVYAACSVPSALAPLCLFEPAEFLTRVHIICALPLLLLSTSPPSLSEDFTFTCPTEITGLSDRAKEFEDLGVKVAVVSTDSKFSHYHWSHQPRNKGGVGKLNIPMVSDLSRKMSRDFGVLIDDESDPDCGIAFRGTFLIDPHGTVRSVQVSHEDGSTYGAC